MRFFLIFLSGVLWAQTTPSPLLNSFKAYQKAKTKTPLRTKWISAGPVLNSARVEAVQGHPNNPNIMYVAFGSGNLWKTVNGGLTWSPIFEDQPALGIGDIALAPSNPDIIYVGTGESLRKNRNFTMPGTGVYRSDDGGGTWTHAGLDYTWHIGEIAIHPEDPDIVLVAAMGKFWTDTDVQGIYRTENGGRSWNRVLYVNKHTRANDIVISPSNPDIMYASMWENNDNNNIAQSVFGPNSGIYGSKNGGKTWIRFTDGLPTEPKIGRIGLAVSYQNPNKVYALMDNRNETKGNSAQVYQTLNGGNSWEQTHDDTLWIFPSNNIGWYFADIYVNPQDDEEIYTLGVRMARSSNGGRSFSTIHGNVHHIQPSPAQTLHLDHCELWIDPNHPNRIAVGNDGGLYVSNDKGQNWLHYNNIPAGEFYDITVDNQTPYNIYGGVQDDATVYGPAKAWQAGQKDEWKYLWIDAWSGGDGCVTEVDPQDPNTVYFSRQHGDGLRKDMAADTSKQIGPAGTELSKTNKIRYNFVSPYIISPHDPQTLYHGGSRVLRSTDRGDSWESISPDITRSSDSNKQAWAGGAISESHLVKGLLFAGTDRGGLWISENGGKDWLERSSGLPMAYIRSIYPSRFSASRIYIAMTGINYDDLNNYLFVSDDLGQTWTSISNNLPNDPANVIIEDSKYENILYAGCYRGVYISMDQGSSWSLFGDNMPAVSVADLAIQERKNDLVVGTHGRGVYFFNLDPIHELKELDTRKQFSLLNVSDVQFPKQVDTHRDVDLSTLTAMPVNVWAPTAGKVQISIIGEDDSIYWTKKKRVKKGLNQFLWDLVISSTSSEKPYFVHYKRYLLPGAYRLQLKAGARIVEKPFDVVEWPY